MSCDRLAGMNWKILGQQLRQSVLDAHGELVDVDIAWAFLIDNPECFGETEWPDMTFMPPMELVAAYLDIQRRAKDRIKDLMAGEGA